VCFHRVDLSFSLVYSHNVDPSFSLDLCCHGFAFYACVSPYFFLGLQLSPAFLVQVEGQKYRQAQVGHQQ
jgi:hypothetical protein